MVSPGLEIGTPLPEREVRPDEVQLFLYNAALFNAHRIHFDQAYAAATEHYPGLVVPGALLGELLGQCVLEWLGETGDLARLRYSNRKAAFLGETLRIGGCVSARDADRGAVHLELWVKNARGEVLAPGSATARLIEPKR